MVQRKLRLRQLLDWCFGGGGGRGVGWNLLRTGFTPSSEKQHSTQSLLKYIPCRWTIVTKIWQNFVRFYFIQVICTLNRKSHLFIKNYHKYNSVIWMIIVKIMFSLAKWTKRKRILWKAKHAVRRLSIKIKIVHFSRLARLTPPPPRWKWSGDWYDKSYSTNLCVT